MSIDLSDQPGSKSSNTRRWVLLAGAGLTALTIA